MTTPPLCNTGGNYPSATPPAVLVDWVSASFPAAMIDDAFRRRLQSCMDASCGPFQARKKGIHGYAHSSESEGVDGFLIAWGGNADTFFVQLSGDACARVQDWTHLSELYADYQGKLTRVDLAFDDFDGEHSVDQAADLYLCEQFKQAHGGRQPSCSQAGNWLAPDGRGRTLYIGKSSNGKMLRVYEKGLQLKPQSGDPWVRWEVQFNNRDRVLPYSMLADPLPFLVGAYPALSFFVDGIATRIPTRRAIERLSVQHLIRHGRIAYGSLLGHLVETGNTEAEIVDTLHRPGLPRRLTTPTSEELCERANDLVALIEKEDRCVA